MKALCLVFKCDAKALHVSKTVSEVHLGQVWAEKGMVGGVYLEPRGREVTAVAVSPVPQSPVVGSAAGGEGIVPCWAPTDPGSAAGAKIGATCSPTAGFSTTVIVDSASDSLEPDQSASQRRIRLRGIFRQLCKLSVHNK